MISGKLYKFSYCFICISVILASGCMKQIVPGGGDYGIKIERRNVGDVIMTYGPRIQNRTMGGGYCCFIDFFPLTIQWETEKGVKKLEKINIKPLIEKLQADHKFYTNVSSNYTKWVKKLLVELSRDELQIYFHTFRFKINPNQLQEKKYLIYTSKQNTKE